MSLYFQRIVSIAFLSGTAVACGNAGTANDNVTFTTAPYSTTTSDSGQLKIELRTSSTDPPERGTIPVQLFVTDAKGAPIDDLALVVVPFMPAMGHGSSVKPSVTFSGGGHYVLSNVSLFMPGRWELRIAIAGKANDHAAPALDVQ